MTFARAVCALTAAVILTGIAVGPQMDTLSDRSFAWHMAQHMLLIFGVAPLLLWADPLLVLRRCFGAAAAASAVRLTAALRRALPPPVTFAAFVGVLWATHFSPLYQASLEHDAVHAFEHALYVCAGVLFWLPVIAPAPYVPPPHVARVLYLLLALPQGAFLAFALDAATVPLYQHYSALLGMQHALADQRNAAALMWIVGGLLLFCAFLATLGRWAARERRALHYAGTFAAVAILTYGGAVRADDGQQLFVQNCSSCHGSRGQGSALAPPLNGRSAADLRFMMETGRMPASAPGVNTVHKRSRLSEHQIDAIVGYVQGLTPGSAGALPQVSGGDVAAGRRLFAENCAHCHSATGNGASVGYDLVAPTLMSASGQQIAEAIRVGPQNMPRFGPDVLSDRDVDDIAAYIKYIQTHNARPDEPNAGGIALAHVGPVAEGFVAWLFGLGVLVLFVRKIGTTQ